MSIQLKFITLVTLLFASGLTYAQNSNYGQNSSGSSRGQGNNSSNKKKADGKKDTIVFKMKVYELQNSYSQIKQTKLDTAFADFQTYNPALKKSISSSKIKYFIK